MPSHISHSIFAEDCIAHLDSSLAEATAGDTELDAAILMGAQGPDIFYHNRRTMPSGLLIGAVLHRKGYGSVSASMLEHCLLHDRSAGSPEGLYLLAFISHGVLDRFLHPFINYFAGWVNPDDAQSEEYRSCHPFLERIIDLAITGRLRPKLFRSKRPVQPLNGFRFADRFDRGDKIHKGIADMILFALKRSYSRMSRDSKLQDRLRNTYQDCLGFYHYSEKPRDKEIPAHWAALLHPFFLPADIDFLNGEQRRWSDPDDDGLYSNDDLWTLYAGAQSAALEVMSVVHSVLNGNAPPEDYPGLPVALGDHGLRNNKANEDQRLSHCDPLPLKGIIERIAVEDYGTDWLPCEQLFTENS